MPTRSSVQEPLPPTQRGSVPRGSPVVLGKTGSFGGDYGSLHGKSAFGLSVTPAVKVGRGTLVGLAGGTSFARGTSSERTREEAKRHLSRLSVVLAAHHTTSPSLQTLGAPHAQRASGQPGGLSLVGLAQHRLEQQQQQLPTPPTEQQPASIPIAQPQPPPPPLPTAQVVVPRGLPSPSCSSSSISSAAAATAAAASAPAAVDPAAAALAYEATCAQGSALFRKLCGTYSSLYRIAKTSPLPHLLCLPREGTGSEGDGSSGEASISYYDVQGHMLAPEIVGDACHSPSSPHPPAADGGGGGGDGDGDGGARRCAGCEAAAGRSQAAGAAGAGAGTLARSVRRQPQPRSVVSVEKRVACVEEEVGQRRLERPREDTAGEEDEDAAQAVRRHRAGPVAPRGARNAAADHRRHGRERGVYRRRQRPRPERRRHGRRRHPPQRRENCQRQAAQGCRLRVHPHGPARAECRPEHHARLELPGGVHRAQPAPQRRRLAGVPRYGSEGAAPGQAKQRHHRLRSGDVGRSNRVVHGRWEAMRHPGRRAVGRGARQRHVHDRRPASDGRSSGGRVSDR
eukprot:Rhum_TRINITY_DN14517_c10_g1::Rhum_TRINITY_DN14517_c10_g1_i1::g.95304::m.95304